MTDQLSIACAIHDRRAAEAYLLASLDQLDGDVPVRFLLDNEGNVMSRNMAHLYNVLARLEGPPIRIFTHADVVFSSDFGRRVASAVEALARQGTRWGALGTVGRAWDGAYVWGHEIDEPAAVCTVDSCCVVIDTRHGLAFDEDTFDGFHCHVEDYCMQSHASGRGVFVIPSVFEHLGTTHALEGSQWGRYPRYRKRLARKWRHAYPELTTT